MRLGIRVQLQMTEKEYTDLLDATNTYMGGGACRRMVSGVVGTEDEDIVLHGKTTNDTAAIFGFVSGYLACMGFDSFMVRKEAPCVERSYYTARKLAPYAQTGK